MQRAIHRRRFLRHLKVYQLFKEADWRPLHAPQPTFFSQNRVTPKVYNIIIL